MDKCLKIFKFQNINRRNKGNENKGYFPFWEKNLYLQNFDL